MNHEAVRQCNIDFPSEIYCGIHHLDNEFFLNRTSFKRKQTNPQQANGKGKRAISESTVKSQRQIVKKLCQFKVKKSFIDVLYSTLSLRTGSFTFCFFLIETSQLGLEQESGKYGNQERTNFKQDLQQITCMYSKQTPENTS